jgi:hypothetical protein
MPNQRTRVPIGLPLAAVILLAAGLIANAIRGNQPEEELATNVLLSAIPFILVFVAIILVFMTIVWLAAGRFSGRITERVYRPIETVIIAGIVLGIISMFQPWLFALYKYGFLLLLVSTLAFILWSHVRPRGAPRVELGSVSVAEIEAKEIEG